MSFSSSFSCQWHHLVSKASAESTVFFFGPSWSELGIINSEMLQLSGKKVEQQLNTAWRKQLFPLTRRDPQVEAIRISCYLTEEHIPIRTGMGNAA